MLDLHLKYTSSVIEKYEGRFLTELMSLPGATGTLIDVSFIIQTLFL